MKLAPSVQKLRGGYYTPEPIARFLCEWAISNDSTRVLEPSGGDGNILVEAADILAGFARPSCKVEEMLTCIEIDEEEASRCIRRLRERGIHATPKNVVVGDFFEHCRQMEASGVKFDAVVGNPPFIRYQNFSEAQRIVALEIMKASGLKPNRLMNAWLPFLVGSTRLLSSKGRLAMVIPAELMQVNYAAETRRFLSETFARITLVTFRRLVFEGIQQEILLLLAEKDGTKPIGIRTIELDSLDDIAVYEHSDFTSEEIKPMDHSSEKWTQYFLTPEEISLLREIKRDSRIDKVSGLAEVDVGIVTGINEFFVVDRDRLKEPALRRYALPIVARSPQLAGVVYSQGDWEAQAHGNLRTFLLNLPKGPPENLPDTLQNYIAEGQKKGFHLGYKCRIRDPWYVVPSVWMPHAFLLRQVHQFPKVIMNRANATCTDTIHRVRFRNGTDQETFAAAFLNSITFAFAEVLGRSYGGGVLELEPKEAEALPIPMIGADRLDFRQIDKLVVAGRIEEVLALTDEVLLKDGLGLSTREARMLRGIWEKLRNRRIARR